MASPTKKHFHSPQATQLSFIRYILPQPSHLHHLEDDGYPRNFNIVPSDKQAETDGKNVLLLVDKRGEMCALISRLVFVQKLSKQKSEIRHKKGKPFGNLHQQGCIFCLTCSYPELTEDHVFTSAYVKDFRIVTRNAVNKSF